MNNYFMPFAAICLLSSTNVFAQVVGGLKYSSYDFGEGVFSDPATIEVSVGYKLTPLDNFSVTPEFAYGTGISSIDSVFGEIEINDYIGFRSRLQYDLTQNIGIYYLPSYGKLARDPFVNSDEWGFSHGAGAEYRLSNDFALDLSYESIDNIGVWSVGIRKVF